MIKVRVHLAVYIMYFNEDVLKFNAFDIKKIRHGFQFVIISLFYFLAYYIEIYVSIY